MGDVRNILEKKEQFGKEGLEHPLTHPAALTHPNALNQPDALTHANSMTGVDDIRTDDVRQVEAANDPGNNVAKQREVEMDRG